MAPIAVRRAPSGLSCLKRATERGGRSESTNVAFLITRHERHRTTHDGVEDFPQEVMAYVAHTHHFLELRPRCPETAAGSIPSLQRIFRMWIENRQLVRLQRIQGTLRVLQGLRRAARLRVPKNFGSLRGQVTRVPSLNGQSSSLNDPPFLKGFQPPSGGERSDTTGQFTIRSLCRGIAAFLASVIDPVRIATLK